MGLALPRFGDLPGQSAQGSKKVLCLALESLPCVIDGPMSIALAVPAAGVAAGRLLAITLRSGVHRESSVGRRASRLIAHVRHLLGSHAPAAVPGLHDVGQRGRHLLVAKVCHRGHRRVVADPVHRDLATQATDHRADCAVGVCLQVVGVVEWRESACHALAIDVVTCGASTVVDRLPVHRRRGGARRQRHTQENSKRFHDDHAIRGTRRNPSDGPSVRCRNAPSANFDGGSRRAGRRTRGASGCRRCRTAGSRR